MAIFDLFSKRQRRLRGETPDVYVYDKLPQALRVQIVHIVDDAFGDPSLTSNTLYKQLHDILARELGRFSLADERPRGAQEDLFNYFLRCEEIELALDWIELVFRVIVITHQDSYKLHTMNARVSADQAVEELNGRLREHGIGFQFESGEIVRVDSSILHQGAVKPTLALLRDKRFSAAETEFLRAHDHYRHARYEESIADALKALESTLKVICAKRGWTYTETDAARALLGVVFSNGLVPAYLQSEFTALRATLESGVPTVRNKQGGHGAGVQPRQLPEHLVSYVLHLTASAILFLAQSEAALP